MFTALVERAFLKFKLDASVRSNHSRARGRRTASTDQNHAVGASTMATRRYNTRSRARNTPPVVPTPEATPGPGAGAGTRRRGSGSSRTAKRSLKLGSASMPTVPDVSNAKEDDIIALARAARNLVDDGLVPSAVRVAAMAVNALDDFAAASGAAVAARTRAAVTLVYADALHKQKQLLYAKSMFEGALELLGGAGSSGNASRDDTPTSRVESGTPARIPAAKLARRSSSRGGTDEVDSVGGLPLLPRNEILFRIARIQLEMDQADGAWATVRRPTDVEHAMPSGLTPLVLCA